MATKLDKYQKMRDFSGTPEPSGLRAEKKKGKALLFVVQKHRASHLHYDFRLEMEGVLKSWAVPKGPSYDPGVRRLAMMTEDHPYDYAFFEGVIPAGNYGAGNVIVWDRGEWEFIEPGDDPVKALKEGKLTFRLKGKKLFGEWALVKLKGKTDKDNEWLLLKHRDEWVSSKVDVTKVAPQSIVSGKLVVQMSEDADATWESNRKSARTRGVTMADRVREKPSRAASTAAGSAKKSAAKAKTSAAKRKTAAKKTAAKKPASKKAAARRRVTPRARKS